MNQPAPLPQPDCDIGNAALVPPTIFDDGYDGSWQDAILHSPQLKVSEYRPRAFQNPTLASGFEALPPEGASACGQAGSITSARMAGNGEPHPKAINDVGCEPTDRLTSRPPSFLHDTPISQGGPENHAA